MDYLKIGKATDLEGRDYRLYRLLEIFPGFFSIATLLVLLVLSYFKPVWVAFFMIAFDVYWLLLVIYLAIYLLVSYFKLKKGKKIDWALACEKLSLETNKKFPEGKTNEELVLKIENTENQKDSLSDAGLRWENIIQMVVLPNAMESADILRTCLNSILNDGFPPEQIIVVLALEERCGEFAKEKGALMQKEFGGRFRNFLVTYHPDGIVGEVKGKGSNQAWATKQAKALIIDPENIPSSRILVSVFDIDTILFPGYFHCLSHKFLTVPSPYRSSYQPIPVFHNNIWQASFFSRVAASSNTFWQMMMQVRQESLVTYSSHSMTYKALLDIGFWSTNMVSEDSRIFWNCLMYYRGEYRVEPLYHLVSMDITADHTMNLTARSLYKQQRRWAWGVESLPYLMFNAIKNWKHLKKRPVISHILVQVYGFHSWATNALIIAVIGWMPMLLGGDRFNSTVLSGNLPTISSFLMNLALIGMVLSAVISSLLLPKRPKEYSAWKNIAMILEWVCVPITIIIFGAIPCLDAQIRLMKGKYMGFWITPKIRN
ncbi:MAG: glycosyltransferase family 2 protein [Candidatus Falkowbacteria bacterium]|nr:glycosyltransferase family 2 protein [Candidatus Falkowbacteria bacterium]